MGVTWEVCAGDPFSPFFWKESRKNESPLVSMLQMEQTDNDLQRARATYLSILTKGKQLGLYEDAHAEPGVSDRKRHISRPFVIGKS
jgi:hypothetical protein